MARALLLLAMGFFLSACAAVFSSHPSSLQYKREYDTSVIVGFDWDDTTSILDVRHLISTAYPKETAICFYGVAKDTIYNTINLLSFHYVAHEKVGIIQHIEPANIMFTDSDLVVYRKPPCRPAWNLIGIGHTHPQVDNGCRHSDQDFLFLNSHSDDFWFSIVFCINNTAQLRLVDGRSFLFPFYFGLDKPKS